MYLDMPSVEALLSCSKYARSCPCHPNANGHFAKDIGRSKEIISWAIYILYHSNLDTHPLSPLRHPPAPYHTLLQIQSYPPTPSLTSHYGFQ